MNLVIQTGRIASDPNTRTTTSGVLTTSFRLAVQRRFKDSNGERQADFHQVVAFRQQAEFISRYLNKGDMIAVTGTLQNRSYDAQDGSKRYVTEIICDNVESLGNRSESAGVHSNEPARDTQTGFAVAEDDDSELPF